MYKTRRTNTRKLRHRSSSRTPTLCSTRHHKTNKSHWSKPLQQPITTYKKDRTLGLCLLWQLPPKGDSALSIPLVARGSSKFSAPYTHRDSKTLVWGEQKHTQETKAPLSAISSKKKIPDWFVGNELEILWRRWHNPFQYLHSFQHQPQIDSAETNTNFFCFEKRESTTLEVGHGSWHLKRNQGVAVYYWLFRRGAQTSQTAAAIDFLISSVEGWHLIQQLIQIYFKQKRGEK